MAIQKAIKGNQNNVRLKIDLDDLFGFRFPDNEALRQAIGQEAIDLILARTERGLDKDGDEFPRYSKEYADSDTFAAFGKSRSDVNLTLRGDMLGRLDIIETTRGSITIGWNDTRQSKKAHNHVNGVTVPERDFLGLTKVEEERIRQVFEDRVKRAGTRTTTEQSVLLEDILGGIISQEAEQDQSQITILSELLGRINGQG